MSRSSKLWGPHSHPKRNVPYVGNDPSVIFGKPAVSGEEHHKAVLQKIPDLEILQPNDVVISALSPDTWSSFQPQFEYDHLRSIYTNDQGMQTELRVNQPIVKEACKEMYNGQIVLTQDRLLKRLPPGYHAHKQRSAPRPSLYNQSSSASTKDTRKTGINVTACEEKPESAYAPAHARRQHLSLRNAAHRMAAAIPRSRHHHERSRRQRSNTLVWESMLQDV